MEATKFAKRLASNEQPERDRAVKKLKKYIAAKSAKSGFNEEELLVLWKGLHYCFWMQDKPLIQEELSRRLCLLLKAFPDVDSALAFAAAFFLTQAREWGRLDQWRMDKFMMLIRDFLHATLEVVKGGGWEGGVVQTFSTTVLGPVMDAAKEDLPDGFRLHLADIFMEELEKVGGEEVKGDQINQLLEPFIQYIAHSESRELIAGKVVSKVFDPILRSVPAADLQSEEEEMENNDDPKLQFDYAGLQKSLFDAGRQKNISAKARRRLYTLVRRLSTMGVKGVESSSLTKKADTSQGDKETDTASKDSTQGDGEEEEAAGEKQMQESSHTGGVSTKKRKRTDEENEEPKKKKKKKKRKMSVEDSEEPAVTTSAPTPSSTPTSTPSLKDRQSVSPSQHKNTHKATPQSTPKHVAFNLERNSSRGLKEFVMSSSNGLSPFLPSRSPSRGILKDSPSLTPRPKSTKSRPSAQSNSPKGKGGKKKGNKASSPGGVVAASSGSLPSVKVKVLKKKLSGHKTAQGASFKGVEKPPSTFVSKKKKVNAGKKPKSK